jgi:hypothetical protein
VRQFLTEAIFVPSVVSLSPPDVFSLECALADLRSGLAKTRVVNFVSCVDLLSGSLLVTTQSSSLLCSKYFCVQRVCSSWASLSD